MAFTAVLLLCFTAAFRYAVEARGYALMMLCFSVALWAWLEAAGGRMIFYYMLLGEYDVASLIEVPDDATAARVLDAPGSPSRRAIVRARGADTRASAPSTRASSASTGPQVNVSGALTSRIGSASAGALRPPLSRGSELLWWLSWPSS